MIMPTACLPFWLVVQPIATARQSALEPGGPAARDIHDLWTLLLWLGVVVTILVLAGLAWALFRRRAGDAVPEADRPADSRGERLNDESGGRGLEGEGRPRSERIGVRAMVLGGAVVPAVILAWVLASAMRVTERVSLPGHTMASFDAPPATTELIIEVTGRQYWWEVEYLDAEPQRRLETANELRIPAGRAVTVRLRSDDVIHSFWVPGLHGKMDLVPGRTNAIVLEASEPGTWRGQCAEYCGVQHAKMAFVVVALPEAQFTEWVERQRADAAAPVDSSGIADRDTYLSSGCVLCHTVRGTPSRGELGPDLTHVASRLTLAAATLPNSEGHLYGWVANPQALKPGSGMPAVPLATEALHAVIRYLQTLR